MLRPTWHYVGAADVGWLIALTGPKVDRTVIVKQLATVHGLDDAAIERADAAVLTALGRGPALTRSRSRPSLAEPGSRAAGTS